ncbi:DUF1479-domain-containing protein [Wolfiporia cocos MD-104 SS10]|uniref:DUF1479-domain-containing protein n=1 Tax=Wolfiporia cocos (strain MD-104) TaxID=742152 RepID=A0A2H3J322_WOLCO|nr:DUF1479-domain-containing protein [Wolfiporia cocos MD-104 SS10]
MLCASRRSPRCLARASRSFATATTPGTLDTETPPIHAFDVRKRARKEEGNIMDVFGALSGQPTVLPERFAELKRELCKDTAKMVLTWWSVLKELDGAVDEISKKGAGVIPQIQYSNITSGLSEQQVKDIKHRGVVIVKGGVSREEALGWKQSIKDYIKQNCELVKGGPPGNIVFYELFNTPAQISARTHPALINTQKALLSLWHDSSPASSSLDTAVSLRTPISYFDRLRIRPPGPSAFTLGPHIDSGGVERWEDPGFRSCFRAILDSSDPEGWRAHDPFDIAPRLQAKLNIYGAPNQCTIVRPWQGWTALSDTGVGEGTLRVLPLLSLSSAYIMLRPFFRRRSDVDPRSLRAEDWELDLESTEFPGSVPGKPQELDASTHPHLDPERAMVSIPRVEPGDQVYWHCDIVHAVESEHNGPGDSSVLYIPAVPLTTYNAVYLRDQVNTFKSGLPSPDFPLGEGESHFVGRVTADIVKDLQARRMLGLAPFEVPTDASAGEAELMKFANSLL